MGPKKTLRTKDLVEKIRAMIGRNRERSIRQMTKEYNVNVSTVWRVVKIDLGLKSYRKNKRQQLSAWILHLQKERCKVLHFTYASVFSVLKPLNKKWENGKY